MAVLIGQWLDNRGQSGLPRQMPAETEMQLVVTDRHNFPAQWLGGEDYWGVCES